MTVRPRVALRSRVVSAGPSVVGIKSLTCRACGSPRPRSVARIDSEVDTLRAGDRVVVPFTISCGSCWMCSRGLCAQCETTQVTEQGRVRDCSATPRSTGRCRAGKRSSCRCRTRTSAPSSWRRTTLTSGTSTCPTSCPPPGRKCSMPMWTRTAPSPCWGWGRWVCLPCAAPCTGASPGSSAWTWCPSGWPQPDRRCGPGRGQQAVRSARQDGGRAGGDRPAGGAAYSDLLGPPRRHRLGLRRLRRDGRPDADDADVRQGRAVADGTVPRQAVDPRAARAARRGPRRAGSGVVGDPPGAVVRGRRRLCDVPAEARRVLQGCSAALALRTP